jgi:hypothetical protein
VTVAAAYGTDTSVLVSGLDQSSDYSFVIFGYDEEARGHSDTHLVIRVSGRPLGRRVKAKLQNASVPFICFPFVNFKSGAFNGQAISDIFRVYLYRNLR